MGQQKTAKVLLADAQDLNQLSQDTTEGAEEARNLGTGLLGSEEQLAADFAEKNVDEFAEYSSRYEIDPMTTAALGGHGWKASRGTLKELVIDSDQYAALETARQALKGINKTEDPEGWTAAKEELLSAKEAYGVEKQRLKGLGVRGYMTDIQGQANDLLAQAEELARGGDSEGADALRKEAQDLIDQMAVRGLKGGFMQTALTLSGLDSEELITRELASPMGQTAGQIVKEGSEILDRDSETSRAYRDSLTQGAERAISAQARGLARNQRDMSLGAGGARQLGAERSFSQRAAETIAGKRAAVHTAAAASYENYRMQLSQDSVAFGRAWMDGASGVRDSFNASMNALRTGGVNLNLQSASQMFQWGQLAFEKRQADRAQSMAIIGMIVGSAMGMIAPMSGAAESVGSSIGSWVSSSGGSAGGAALSTTAGGKAQQAATSAGAFF